MCFSPEADLVAGIAVGAIGIDALHHATDRRDVALAALPLAFGAHQLVETLVWWGNEGQVPAHVGEAAAWWYLLFAYLLPLIAPLAILASERDRGRRRAMVPFVLVGAGVSAVLIAALIRGPVVASVGDMHIHYEVHIPAGITLTVLYVIATCGTPLLSRRPALVGFGVANLVAVAVLAWAMVEGFASMWCMWAAVTSVLIDLHLRHTGATPQPPAPTAGAHRRLQQPARPTG